MTCACEGVPPNNFICHSCLRSRVEALEGALREAADRLGRLPADVDKAPKIMRSLTLVAGVIDAREILSAALQPDKGERCETCGGTGWLDPRAEHAPCPGCPDCGHGPVVRNIDNSCGTCGGKRIVPTRKDWPDGRSPCVFPCADCKEAP